MSSEALWLVLDYIDPARREPHVRCNAVAALATLRSTGPLVSMALQDPDAGVRAVAAQEIEQLDRGAQEEAAALLRERLAKDPGERRASRLLGRLRRAGLARVEGDVSIGAQLRQAWGAMPSLHEMRPSWATCWIGFAGGMAGAILMLLYQLFAPGFNPGEEVVKVVLFGGVPLAVLLAAGVGNLVNPLPEHAYVGAGLAVDAILVFAVCSALSCLGFVWVYWALIEGAAVWYEALAAVLMASAATGLAAVCARAGTALWVGQTANSTAGTWASASCGAALATAMLTATFALAQAALPESWSMLDASMSLRDLVPSFWLAALPASVALGILFARIDGRIPSVPLAGPSTRWIGVVAPLGVAALATYVAMPEWNPPAPAHPVALSSSKQNDEVSFSAIEVEQLPMSVTIELRSPQSLEASIGSDPLERDLTLELRSEKGSITKVDDSATKPERLFEPLESGTYTVTASLYQSTLGEEPDSPKDVLPSIVERLTRRARPAQSGRSPLFLNVVLNGSNPLLTTGLNSELGPIHAGAIVKIRKPDDTSEGPGWIPDMDEFVGKPLTVQEIDDGTFRVVESPWEWSPSWVTSLKVPPAPPPRKQTGRLYFAGFEVQARVKIEVVASKRDLLPEEFSAWVGKQMTVKEVVPLGDAASVLVEENDLHWPPQWIEVAAPASGYQ